MRFFNATPMQKTNYYKQTILHFPLEAIFVGHFYDGVIQKKLHRFKFVHNTVDSVYFESTFRHLVEESGIQKNHESIIIYPPISFKDRLFRWPNHAKKLAIIFAKIIGSNHIYCPFQKKFFAGHQSLRNKHERKNIQLEYFLKKNISCDFRDKEVFMIDDIITTGYTAYTLGTLLQGLRPKRITGFFLASHKV